ncbi:MAG: cold shock domain-containing protein [Bacteroidales bacterium]|jgi:cold shock CspA family protein|nr:cold shock domain-containing protein [Bacteroidales bacterium]MDD3663767.1 cold shock domain-containing protein [Bacteroidales bacterium]
MARSQESFNKREKEKNRIKKRLEKEQKKEERKQNSSGGDLDSMIAWVDEFGNITDTPPDPTNKTVIDPESIEVSVRRRDDEDFDPVRKGKVDYFNTSKGFGFIFEEGNRDRLFFHINSLIGEVAEGDKVSFEVERGPKGLNAVKVQRIS